MTLFGQVLVARDGLLAGSLRTLRTLDGVRSVRLNDKTASVTVYYDTGVTGAQSILDFPATECLRPAPVQPAKVRRTHRPSKTGRELAAEIGKMALGVLVSKGVSYSLSTLLGARV